MAKKTGKKAKKAAKRVTSKPVKRKVVAKTSKKHHLPKLSKRNDFITIKRNAIKPPQVAKETPYPMQNLDGDVLAGVLHEPAKWSNTLVILFHGFLTSKDQTLIRQTAIELSRAGYASYRADFSGNGDSEGRFEDATPKKLLRDITATVEHFRKKYQRIMLLGHSIGGTLSLIAASRTKIDGLILVAPALQLHRFTDTLTPQQNKELLSVGFTIITLKRPVGEIPYTITDRFVQECKDLHPLDAARDVHCPVIIIRGSEDVWNGVKVSTTEDDEKLLKTLFSKEFVLIGGANHNFTGPGQIEGLVAEVIGWLRKLR